MEARTESDIRPIHKPIRDIGFIGHPNIHTCGSRKGKKRSRCFADENQVVKDNLGICRHSDS